MSDDLGTYAFLPWLRFGAATRIGRQDGSAGTSAREEIPITVSLNAGAANVTLPLFGPGEVTGFDRRAVIRAWPAPDVWDAEANYFPLVEFAQGDLPWRYTPASADAADRVRPWMCLIVLQDGEISGRRPAAADRPFPSVTVSSAASLPDPAQAWAWAHAQVAGEASVSPALISDILARSPERLTSRLLCPRRLAPQTRYHGFIVPLFERGRRAGLGAAVDQGGVVDALTPAWSGTGSVELPIYYEWTFGTGVAGDFEYLIRLLETRVMPPTLGIRDMAVAQPGQGLPPAASTPLGMEGALRAIDTHSTTWMPADRDAWVAALRPLVNREADLLAGGSQTRIVAPPLYGRWHARQHTLEASGRPVWFNELNADPRDRVGAGLGTLVIQEQQRQLMASAWRQVEGIKRINEERRRAQAARELAGRLKARHLDVLDDQAALLLTAPVHARVLGSPVTIQALFDASPVPAGILHAQFRRVARPLGPIGRRQGRLAAPRTGELVDRLNRGELSPAPPPSLPDKLTTPTRVGDDFIPAGTTAASAAARLRNAGRIAWWGWILLLLAAVLFAILGLGLWVAVAAAAGLAAVAGGAATRRTAVDLGRRVAWRDGTLTADDVRAVAPAPDFVPRELGAGAIPGSTPPPTTPTAAQIATAQAAFAQAAGDLFTRMGAPVITPPPLVPVELAGVRAKLSTALDPRVTVAAAHRARLRLAPGVLAQEDPLDEVMAAPVFEQPMYEPLRDLSQDWLLPGLDKVPPNTVSLLTTNQRFVEAYMLGLSHEMARELLWNEYPTDQRGTYFRQFWDIAGHVGATSDSEGLKDIKPIHQWNRDQALGNNTSRQPPPGGEYLVLLVRGELLRRYPNSIVYAEKAKLGSDGLRDLDESVPIRTYLFTGALRPDVSFFGFDLTPTEARGTTEPGGDQGWFFVIAEQPVEPRFGLDEPEPDATYGAAVSDWNDLSWASLVPTAGALAAYGHVNLGDTLPNVAGAEATTPGAVWHATGSGGGRGSRASDLAYITLQRPMRVAWHASDMLPPAT